MTNPIGLIRAAQVKDGVVEDGQWFAILELTMVTFFMTLIPKFLALGRPPITLAECWEPVLTALLMALYSYARARNIEVTTKVER